MVDLLLALFSFLGYNLITRYSSTYPFVETCGIQCQTAGQWANKSCLKLDLIRSQKLEFTDEIYEFIY